MIEIATTFIIGAGGGVPYGLPSGLRLVSNLCITAYADIHQSMDVTRAEYARFADTLRKSQLYSIDEFLAHHQEEWGELGRRAIAAWLLPGEDQAQIKCVDSETAPHDGRYPVPPTMKRGHWLRHLWNKLKTPELNGLASNEVNFVVFNYDRLLEQYLWTAIQNTYPGHNVEEYAHVMSTFRIMHPYGTLGRFDYGRHEDGHSIGDGEPVAFGSRTADAIHAAAKSIRIIPEHRVEKDPFEDARRMMHESKRLIFLGFGYERINMIRLDVNRWCEQRSNPTYLKYAHALGTAYGLMHAEVEKIRAKYFSGAPNCLGGPDQDALEFLRAEVDLEKGEIDKPPSGQI